MAHAKINLQRMLAWIVDCLAAGQHAPSDGDICERFGFDSPESARTLLADLADAGSITIRGWGEARTIVVGRVRGAFSPIGRVEPSVKREDPAIAAAAAHIVAIANRHRKPAAAVMAENAGKLLSTVNKPAAKKPAPPVQEKPVMPAKSVCLPASAVTAIAALEEHAKSAGLPLGAAAAALIERGAGKIEALAEPTSAFALPLDRLLEQISARFAERPDNAADLAAAIDRAELAEARAEMAESKLAQMKALFA